MRLERAQDRSEALAFGGRARRARVAEVLGQPFGELVRLEIDLAAGVALARRQRAVAAALVQLGQAEEARALDVGAHQAQL